MAKTALIGPDNFEAINTDAVENIDINIEDAWNTYSETENKRTVTVAIIDTGIDTTHTDLKDSIWVNEDEIPGDGIDNDGNGTVEAKDGNGDPIHLTLQDGAIRVS